MVTHSNVGLVLMVGGGGRTTSVERTLRQARQVAALDLIDQLLNISRAYQIIVLTDNVAWAGSVDSLHVTLELTSSDEPFHFGQALARTIVRYELKGCFYLGGGSAPLLSSADLTKILLGIHDEQPQLVTNNMHSSDWAAFSPATAILPLVEWLERDNALAWVWHEKTGHPVKVLPRSTATQVDIDTPFDLLALARHPGIQPRLQGFLRQLDWPTAHLDAVLDVFRREASHVIVAGRVSSWTWRMLEQHTRVWIRVFSEERGMRASGRQAAGQVCSLLNDYMDLVGVERFFHRLAELSDAIVLDSRVILASRGLWPCDGDRFHSDLLMDAEIGDPFLRALTSAARSAPIPVLMGGHSLVAGGLAALLEGTELAVNSSA